MKKTFEKTEYDVGALVNDGLHVRSKYAAASTLGPAPTAGLLASCEERVFDATGFRIKLKIKEFEVPRIVADAYIAADMRSAGEYLRSMLKLELYTDNKLIFYKQDRVFLVATSTHAAVEIEAKVRARVLHGPLIFEVGPQERLRRMSTNDIPSREYTKYLCDNPIERPGLHEEIIRSSAEKLGFRDGYYCFREKTFHKWGEGPGMMTLAIVPRKFPACATDPANVMEHVLEPIFPDREQLQFNLAALARSMAGNCDKMWFCCAGDRHGGKTMLMHLCELAFGMQLVRTCNAMSFRANDGGADEAKARSWMVDHIPTRLCFTSELEEKNGVPVPLSGGMIKSFTGNDVVCARKNFCDEVYFRLQLTLWMCANDQVQTNPVDALETCVSNPFSTIFLDPGDERLKRGGVYRPKNEDLKEQLPAYRDEFLMLVLKSWQPQKPMVPEQLLLVKEEGDTGDDRDLFLRLFDAGPEEVGEETSDPENSLLTPDQVDTMTHDDIRQHLKEISGADEYGRLQEIRAEYRHFSDRVTNTKINRWLRSVGCIIRRRQSDGMRCPLVTHIAKKNQCARARRRRNARDPGVVNTLGGSFSLN